ncbi:hypothetical protein [Pontibacter mangrovi]|uniref:Uncharacterized protein n=1 Tax=Pontibacter mangrovi TaxID=2589816 RepID=A0A501W5Q5_9BACT|nr:hypothetical protein [Pontibacter mangrovi]TPE42611.1 hypothetical protein FJM65_17515 [Pontibacter mangrovi]
MANYFLSILMLLALGQCHDEILPELVPQKPAYGKPFTMEPDERVELINGDSLYLELERVEDSRCPQDVVCVWMGNASVELRVGQIGRKGQKLNFCIGDCRPEPARSKHPIEVLVDGKAYEVTLLEVLPYPSEANTDTEKQVKLIVTKK